MYIVAFENSMEILGKDEAIERAKTFANYQGKRVMVYVVTLVNIVEPPEMQTPPKKLA